MHRIVLSKMAPLKISAAAQRGSAVSSTTDTGIPGPAAITRLPVPNASRTSSAPPVMQSMSTPACVTRSRAVSSVGATTPVIRLSGPPAATTASFISSTVRIDVHLQPGCALNATAFPPASIVMPWLIMNADGELVGVTEATTPHGSQSSIVSPCWPANARGSSKSSVPTERSAASCIFATLSRTRPSPVSSCAACASGSACSWPTRRMAAIAVCRSATPPFASARWAVRAASTASPTVANRPCRPLAASGSRPVAAAGDDPAAGAGCSRSSPTTRRTMASSSESEIGTRRPTCDEPPIGRVAPSASCGFAMTCTAATSETRPAAAAPASVAALTAATSPRTTAVTRPPPIDS